MINNMPSILEKNFSTLGKIEYKIASTPKEMEDALSLVYREYVKHRLIDPNEYKSPIRIGINHILPEKSTIFIGRKDQEVIITFSTFHDSPLGLPIEAGYQKETQFLRDQGRKIGEGGCLAVESSLFKNKRTSRAYIEKIHFIFTILRMAIHHNLYYTDIDDAVMVTNPHPKRKMLKHFPIEPIGEIKNYGFDEVDVNPKAAIAERFDFRMLRKAMKNPLELFNYKKALFFLTFGGDIPKTVFNQKLHLTVKDLHYFFVQKSNILLSLKPHELNYVLSSYGLNHDDYKKLISNQLENNLSKTSRTNASRSISNEKMDHRHAPLRPQYPTAAGNHASPVSLLKAPSDPHH